MRLWQATVAALVPDRLAELARALGLAAAGDESEVALARLLGARSHSGFRLPSHEARFSPGCGLRYIERDRVEIAILIVRAGG